MGKILVLDDDASILMLIKNALQKDGHLVTIYDSAEKISLNSLGQYDLLLLDIMMPGTDGFTFCKKIRTMVDCPILFLTAKTLEEDIMYGLSIGADDYLTKPFRIGELRARIQAHLRREHREHHNVLCFNHIKFDLSAKILFVDDTPVALTKSEYAICEYLAHHHGQVLSKEQICEAVFGFDSESDNSTIATHIKNIRMKFSDLSFQPITTVWGCGYRWTA